MAILLIYNHLRDALEQRDDKKNSGDAYIDIWVEINEKAYPIELNTRQSNALSKMAPVSCLITTAI